MSFIKCVGSTALSSRYSKCQTLKFHWYAHQERRETAHKTLLTPSGRLVIGNMDPLDKCALISQNRTHKNFYKPELMRSDMAERLFGVLSR